MGSLARFSHRYVPSDEILEGLVMSKLSAHPMLTLLFGIAVGATAVWLLPQQPLTAGTANSADMFSMVTVPVEGIADTEAVFVLDHLTGIIRGGRLNNRTSKFTHQYVHSVADDFKLQGQKNPEYTIVSGSAQLAGQGPQPALGLLYIGEKSTGAVIAYGFEMPQGRGSNQPQPLYKLDGFFFRERI